MIQVRFVPVIDAPAILDVWVTAKGLPLLVGWVRHASAGGWVARTRAQNIGHGADVGERPGRTSAAAWLSLTPYFAQWPKVRAAA
jgi:hypothetical protein